MTDDIRSLTARLAADPDSLVFLQLGEALRRRGQLQVALTVAEGGASRYPHLADAHDLVARIRVDRGEGDLAFDSWTEALQHDPQHPGALRGLAYLAFRAGDLARAERHLTAVLAVAPDDPALRAALERVRSHHTPPEAPQPAGPPLGGGPDAHGAVLADTQGRRLAGSMRDPGGADVSEAVAAELALVAREAERAARLLELGEWRSLGVECEDGHIHLLPASADTLLVAAAGPEVAPGRLALVAERAALAARRWLERLG